MLDVIGRDVNICNALRSQQLTVGGDDRRVSLPCRQRDAGVAAMQQTGGHDVAQKQERHKNACTDGGCHRRREDFSLSHGLNGAGPFSRRPK